MTLIPLNKFQPSLFVYRPFQGDAPFVDPFSYLCFKFICVINFAKPFLKFIADTIIWYLNSMLDFNISCSKDFRNMSFMMTKCISWL